MNETKSKVAHVKPLPTPDPDTEEYWRGLKDGRLLLQHCIDCGNIQFYQQAICRKCASECLEHRAASGLGVIHSFSVVYRAPGPAFRSETPYAVLLVELDEGPRMISTLVGADVTDIEFGMQVQLVCEKVSEDISLPRFRPI